MKLAVLSESVYDESALRVLIEAVRPGAFTFLSNEDDPQGSRFRSCGWPGVCDTGLPAFLRYVVARHADVVGVVVVVDSDHSPVHVPAHDEKTDNDCRLCKLRTQSERELSKVSQRQTTLPKVLLGLAVPAIEAWLLDPQQHARHCITEESWSRSVEYGSCTPTAKRGAEIKQQVYGHTRCRGKKDGNRKVEAAQAAAAQVDRLEADFPGGFGTFAASLRALQPPRA